MDKEEISTELLKARWAIAPEWFPENNRSISALIQNCLCPRCARQLSAGEKENSPDVLMQTIKECCSREPGFITNRLPILEGVFRLFLANGNQPLDLEELENQLSEWRGKDSYHTSEEILARLLKDERYYGIRQVID